MSLIEADHIDTDPKPVKQSIPSRSWKDRLRGKILGSLVWFGMKLAMWTLRITVVGAEHLEGARKQMDAEGKKLAWAFWHGRQSLLLPTHGHDPILILASWSRDGEVQSQLLRRYGFTVTRGSSSRGAARGLITMIRGCRNGLEAGFAADGPRGPRYEAKPGVILLARKLQNVILPVSCGADNPWWVGSWDRTMIPRPFSRCVIMYGEPMRVPKEGGNEALEQHRVALEQQLRRMTQEVDTFFDEK